jgi:hypothetical protein
MSDFYEQGPVSTEPSLLYRGVSLRNFLKFKVKPFNLFPVVPNLAEHKEGYDQPDGPEQHPVHNEGVIGHGSGVSSGWKSNTSGFWVCM